MFICNGRKYIMKKNVKGGGRTPLKARFLGRRKNLAFTLVEMLIVIVVIWILASAIIPKIIGVIDRAHSLKAKLDMQHIANAIELLKNDTWEGIGGRPASSCVRDEEYTLNPNPPYCAWWLTCNTAVLNGKIYTFANWGWPYIESDILTDRWWEYYEFDYDTICEEWKLDPKKCWIDLNLEKNKNRKTFVIVGIYSKWPDRQASYSDNIVFPICIPSKYK